MVNTQLVCVDILYVKETVTSSVHLKSCASHFTPAPFDGPISRGLSEIFDVVGRLFGADKHMGYNIAKHVGCFTTLQPHEEHGEQCWESRRLLCGGFQKLRPLFVHPLLLCTPVNVLALCCIAV